MHYPETDHMGEDFLQRAIAEALRPLIARWFKSRRVKAFTGADQFLYLSLIHISEPTRPY